MGTIQTRVQILAPNAVRVTHTPTRSNDFSRSPDRPWLDWGEWFNDFRRKQETLRLRASSFTM